MDCRDPKRLWDGWQTFRCAASVKLALPRGVGKSCCLELSTPNAAIETLSFSNFRRRANCRSAKCGSQLCLKLQLVLVHQFNFPVWYLPQTVLAVNISYRLLPSP
jgi:hypothetical protein